MAFHRRPAAPRPFQLRAMGVSAYQRSRSGILAGQSICIRPASHPARQIKCTARRRRDLVPSHRRRRAQYGSRSSDDGAASLARRSGSASRSHLGSAGGRRYCASWRAESYRRRRPTSAARRVLIRLLSIASYNAAGKRWYGRSRPRFEGRALRRRIASATVSASSGQPKARTVAPSTQYLKRGVRAQLAGPSASRSA